MAEARLQRPDVPLAPYASCAEHGITAVGQRFWLHRQEYAVTGLDPCWGLFAYQPVALRLRVIRRLSIWRASMIRWLNGPALDWRTAALAGEITQRDHLTDAARIPERQNLDTSAKFIHTRANS